MIRPQPRDGQRPRPNCLFWARSRADLTPCPDWALKRIPRHAPAVLEMLNQGEQRWREIEYGRVRSRLGLTQAQVERCMLALRNTGLIEFRVQRRRFQTLDEGTGEWLEGYGSQAWARPLASCDKGRSGALATYVPEDFLRMAEKRNTRGGKRPGAGRPRKSNAGVTPTSCADNSLKLDVVGKSNDGIIYNTYSHSSDSINPRRGASFDAAPAASLSFKSEGTGFDLDALANILRSDQDSAGARPAKPARRERIPATQRGPRPQVPPLDEPETRWVGTRIRVPDMPTSFAVKDAAAAGDHELAGRSREARVRIVVDAYNAALVKVYGPGEARGYFRPDLTRSKLYPLLCAAADVLCDRDIPPGSWAEWRLAQAKARGEKPWPIGRVMQPKTVARCWGLWKHEAHVPAEIVKKYDRWHIEQMLRAREAWARWEWGEDPPMSSTKWYGDMRREERARGELDPLFNWPSPRNSPMRGAPR